MLGASKPQLRWQLMRGRNRAMGKKPQAPEAAAAPPQAPEAAAAAPRTAAAAAPAAADYGRGCGGRLICGRNANKPT